MRIAVLETPFDFGAEAGGFAAGHTDMGAVVTFSGIVRADDDLQVLEIEHYPGMTESQLTRFAQQAQDRWGLGDVLILHRTGRMVPGEIIMMVATAAPHRKDAFEAAEYLMDYLKSRAPFWKREIGKDGTTCWVAAKDDDEDALGRW